MCNESYSVCERLGLFGIPSSHCAAKVSIIYQGRSGRTYISDALHFAHDHLDGLRDIAILTNADIFFDGTLRFIIEDPRLSMQQPKPVLYALSRLEAFRYNRQFDMCVKHYAGSHDSFVFLPGTVDALVRPRVHFPIGYLGYENRLLFELAKQGFILENPCQSVRSFHIHKSNVRHREGMARINTHGQSKVVKPHLHVLDGNRILLPGRC